MINIFKLFKEWKKRKEAKIFNALVTKKLEKAISLDIHSHKFDKASDELKMLLMSLAQTHKFITYKKTGHFCEDPEENIKFIEEMEETTGEFKKKISKYQDAKNKYNEILANQGEV